MVSNSICIQLVSSKQPLQHQFRNIHFVTYRLPDPVISFVPNIIIILHNQIRDMKHMDKLINIEASAALAEPKMQQQFHSACQKH